MAAFVGDTALAAESPERCIGIASDAERLACFDAAFAAGTQAANTDSASVAQAGVALGAAAAATDQSDFGREKTMDEIEGESMTSGIVATGEDAYDRIIFELDNGQIWQQVESKRFPVKDGQTAEIRHGSFGSYKLYIVGESRWTRVRRVE